MVSLPCPEDPLHRYFNILPLMKKLFVALGVPLLFAAAVLSLPSCDDRTLGVGDSIRPIEDEMTPKVDSLELEVRTIQIDSIYSRSTYTLLGHLADPYFGDLRASYIARFQHAPGFRFATQPIDDRIDSVLLQLSYSKFAGDSTVWSKATAYEIMQTLPDSRYSQDLSIYCQGAKQLGSLTYQAGDPKGRRVKYIRLPLELGERIYKASKEHPEYFDTQEAFERNLLRGIFVEATTGSGSMLSIYNTSLLLAYTAEVADTTKDGRDTIVRKVRTEQFASTNQLYMLRNFQHNRQSELLKPNPDYGFIKAPQGVAMQLTLSVETLAKTFLKDGKKPNDRELFINESSLSMKADIPSSERTQLNPPGYLLLLPKDSLKTFFEGAHSELTMPEAAVLSSLYNANTRLYTFDNLSRPILTHLHHHMEQRPDGTYRIQKPIEWVVVPVERALVPNDRGGASTSSLNNFLFPVGLRVRLKDGKLPLAIVSTYYQGAKK